MLFFSCMLVVAILVLLDKALITYWFKPMPLQSDLLDRTFLMILKYAPCLFLLFTGLIIQKNYCLFSNDEVKQQEYYMQFESC